MSEFAEAMKRLGEELAAREAVREALRRRMPTPTRHTLDQQLHAGPPAHSLEAWRRDNDLPPAARRALAGLHADELAGALAHAVAGRPVDLGGCRDAVGKPITSAPAGPRLDVQPHPDAALDQLVSEAAQQLSEPARPARVGLADAQLRDPDPYRVAAANIIAAFDLDRPEVSL